MKFIEALKLKSKLFLLFILITFALLLLGLLGTIYTKDLKSRIDALYFGSLMPVSELHDILYTYNAVLAPNIYKIKFSPLPNEELEEILKSSMKNIKKNWISYTNHYKTKEELAYLSYATVELKKSLLYFQKLLILVQKRRDITKLSLSVFESNLEHINQVIKRLVDYELSSAKLERKNFLASYEKNIRWMSTLLVLIIVGILYVVYYVFRSIQKEHNKLEIATKKLRSLNQKLENASYTDSLTGLHNRRYFNLVYERELKRAKRERRYITFMMIDIDFFKQYNDTYGHIAGDHTLKIVAKVLKSSFRRPSDYVFRLGGEEFGVLLVDTDELSSARLAKELCKRVKEQQIEHKASKVADVVTISVGVVSCVADDALDEDLLIKIADDMLYKAKEGGRDRYMITSEVYQSPSKESHVTSHAA